MNSMRRSLPLIPNLLANSSWPTLEPKQPLMRKPGSKERIRQFLLLHIGEVVTANQIRKAVGTQVTEWARRVRELREDEKWSILTHNDRADLKPGQYILTAPPPTREGILFSRPISAKLRA